tara:strand:- start:522 stop:782 length:261 start_codon:yes stop_codon:yes gene_type:complete
MKNLIKCIRGAYELHTTSEQSELNKAHLNLNYFERFVLKAYMRSSIKILKVRIFLLKNKIRYRLEINVLAIVLIIVLLFKNLKGAY